MKGILEIVALNEVKLVEIFLYMRPRKKCFFSSYIWDWREYIIWRIQDHGKWMGKSAPRIRDTWIVLIFKKNNKTVFKLLIYPCSHFKQISFTFSSIPKQKTPIRNFAACLDKVFLTSWCTWNRNSTLKGMGIHTCYN